MSLHILDPGLCTLIVDFGRPHCRALGIPVGGAADRTALSLGNSLVGNPPHAAALECNLYGPTVKAQCDLACVVYGAPFEAKCGHRRLQVGKTFTLFAGEVLAIGPAHEGMRGYFCVAGGLHAKTILASQSSFEPLQAKLTIQCREATTRARFMPIEWHWDTGAPQGPAGAKVIRVLDGAQSDWFPRGWFDDRTFAVSPAGNRMGLRLQGEPLPLANRELISEPVCPGSVQVTRNGQCIILGIDGQTIGGYPKIAQVISADLDALAQIRPGEKIAFQRVNLDEAAQLWRAKQAELQYWVRRIQLARQAG